MRRPLFRPPLLLTAVAACLLTAGTAAAQFDGGTSGSSFTSDDFFIRIQDPPGSNLSDFEVARFFNKARCDCDAPATIYVTLSQTGLAKLATASNNGSIEVWIGSGCNDTTSGARAARCHFFQSTLMSVFLRDQSARQQIETTARMLSGQPFLGAVPDGGGGIGFPNPDCTTLGQNFTQTIWVLIDADNDGVVDVSATQDVLIDLTPPPTPVYPPPEELAAGNQALVINWQRVDTGIYPDVVGYQVLCNRGGALQVFSPGTFGATFQTCDPNNADLGVEARDPKYVCSPLLSPTTSSYRIKILQNEIVYGAAVVAIDASGNASAPDILYGTPIKTKSFYDVYRNDDPAHPGTASGGLCTLSAGATSAGSVAGLSAALALAAIVLARRGRRRR